MVIVIALQLEFIMNYVVAETNYLFRVQKCAGSIAKKIRSPDTISIGSIATSDSSNTTFFHFLFLRCSSMHSGGVSSPCVP